MSDTSIHVTQPYLPPLEEFIPYLEEIWESKQLTNSGPMHQKLELALCNHLGVAQLALFNNGTTALLAAIKALDISGEVITTPYSFAATSHALIWNQLTPVFADIDPDTLNIDPIKIEEAITKQTSAILAVHCYGTPCNVERIKKIAEEYDLKVIYDAAHAFGVNDGSGSLLRHGDLSTLSFHATKVFNTIEGGAIICHDEETKKKIDSLKNFGIIDETTVTSSGINGKMSEINAAFGLLQLKYNDHAISLRQKIDKTYRSQLGGISGISLPSHGNAIAPNYSYFPILVEPSYPLSRDDLYHLLQDHGIHSRRYFYPLISEMPMYHSLPSASPSNLPVATETARKVLCLPIYPLLDQNSQERIINLIKRGGK